MLKIIFHVGILKVCMRMNFRKMFENIMPIRYKQMMLDVATVKMYVPDDSLSASVFSF
jgi:hypothetical protein